MRLTTPRRITALAVAALTAALAAPSLGATPARAAARPAGVTRVGQWLVDPQGRAVVMHGFNLVRKTAPFYPGTITDADGRLLAQEGFTLVRLGVIWQGAEPTPGHYDDRYLHKVIAIADLLGRHGIRTFLDLHQDQWSAKAGGDGAPDWATVGTTMLDDWQQFWDDAPAADGVGIQTRFVALWRHLADLVKADRAVIGYDPINEPYPGEKAGCSPVTYCPTWAGTTLAAFYRRVIGAIRTVDPYRLVLPEPNPLHSNPDVLPTQTIGLPAFADRQTIFSFHSYCLLTEAGVLGDSAPAATACAPSNSQSVGQYAAYSSSLAVPALCGEFSANDDNADNIDMIDRLDTDLMSWTSWAYTYYPGDPASGLKDTILLDPTKPASEANAKQAKLDAFAVPYAQATAGTPTSYTFDRATGVMSYRWSTTTPAGSHATGRTRIVVPARHYPHGYAVTVTGGTVVSPPGARWLEITAQRGADTVAVSVSPR